MKEIHFEEGTFERNTFSKVKDRQPNKFERKENIGCTRCLCASFFENLNQRMIFSICLQDRPEKFICAKTIQDTFLVSLSDWWTKAKVAVTK